TYTSTTEIYTLSYTTLFRSHIGVAVAVKDGLLVPVIRFADNKSLSHIAVEVKDLAQRAHDKKLQPSDWEGSTFTVSNLGMFGIRSEEHTSELQSRENLVCRL